MGNKKPVSKRKPSFKTLLFQKKKQKHDRKAFALLCTFQKTTADQARPTTLINNNPMTSNNQHNNDDNSNNEIPQHYHPIRRL
jgi:hypothetical protein